MFLSFVIPIYNCENNIGSNLNVIHSSNLKYADYEIVLVDDGSIDKGVDICREYSNKYDNILVLLFLLMFFLVLLQLFLYYQLFNRLFHV